MTHVGAVGNLLSLGLAVLVTTRARSVVGVVRDAWSRLTKTRSAEGQPAIHCRTQKRLC